MATIAQNLKRLREEAAMTQEDLAASAKLKQAAISKYEMGKASPNVKSLMKLAIGLGRPLDALVRDVNDDYTALVVARAPVDAPASAGVDSEKVRTIAAELRLHIETLINRVLRNRLFRSTNQRIRQSTNRLDPPRSRPPGFLALPASSLL